MATGKVKWFNSEKGYGFIAPDRGGPDVFVHVSDVKKAGLETLPEGKSVSYEMGQGKNGRLCAHNISLL